MLHSICEEKKHVFADLRKFSVRKSQKDLVCKSQFRKMHHLRMVRKSNEIFNVSPQICGFAELICGPPTFDCLGQY